MPTLLGLTALASRRASKYSLSLAGMRSEEEEVCRILKMAKVAQRMMIKEKTQSRKMVGKTQIKMINHAGLLKSLKNG